MTIPQLLVNQVKDTHGTIVATTQDVTDEIAHWQPPGTAHSIASTWIHAVVTDDFVTQRVLKQTSPLYESEWRDKVGISKLQPAPSGNWEQEYSQWTKDVRMELDMFRAYMEAVFKATESYIAQLSQEEV